MTRAFNSHVEKIASVFVLSKTKLSHQAFYSVNMAILMESCCLVGLGKGISFWCCEFVGVFDSVTGEREMTAVRTVTEISAIKKPFGQEVELIHCLSLFQLQFCRKSLVS